MRRASFWLAVGGVSLLTQFAVQLAATKLQIPGLGQFVAFTQGNTGGQSA